MDNRQIQNILNKFGFQAGIPDGVIGGNTKGAVARFQTAYNVRWLGIDAQPGPDTQAALGDLDASGGRLSANFMYDELKCHHCGLCFVNRGLLAYMESLRRISGIPVEVVDAYRCPAHNAAIGGALNSKHPFGVAFDPRKGKFTEEQCHQAGFDGIGKDGNLIDHLDIREGLVDFPDPGSG